MDSLEPSDVVYRAVSMLVADPQSGLDRDERAACLCWLQGLPHNVLLLIPEDMTEHLLLYISAHQPDMLDALSQVLSVPLVLVPKFLMLDSPLEIHFGRAWEEEGLDLVYPLTPQYPFKGGKYYLDFAYPRFKVGIELDSYTYHSSREQFNRDRERQREIEADGWRMIRFSGDELRTDISKCIGEAAHFISVQGFRQQRLEQFNDNL